MDLLQVKHEQIVNAASRPVYLRGVCVGGWMNMEDFINGHSGSEHGLRTWMTDILGAKRAEFFFDRFEDYFFAEEDIAYLQSLGANVVRLPLNYHYFESDEAPYQYLEKGFRRLDQMIQWCAQHNMYVILDLHSAQGWQNPDWHCDNQTRHSLFWRFKEFQDRFVALWEAIARRYVGNPTVAGYNVLNEPVTGNTLGRLPFPYRSDWERINQVYRRVVWAIRAIDPDHIIFLEGDLFSSRFEGLDTPYAANLVYASHNYSEAGFGPGRYPGKINGKEWNRDVQRQVMESHEGYVFAKKHKVPLWIGEFGAAYNGPAEEIPDRLQALSDQLDNYNEAGLAWTTWTYKDLYVMGLVQPMPDAAYLKAIDPVIQAKKELASDFWMGWLPPSAIKQQAWALADVFAAKVHDPALNPQDNRTYLTQAVLSCYAADLLQPTFARCFEKMSEKEMDTVLSSWALKNCKPNAGLEAVLKQHFAQ